MQIKPDDNITNIVIPFAKLPYPDVNGYYNFKFRLISPEKQELSNWTINNKVLSQTTQQIVTDIIGKNVSGSYSYDPDSPDLYPDSPGVSSYDVVSDGKAMTVTWKTPDTLPFDTFDVFARWYESFSDTTPTLWTYVGTTKANNISTNIPDEYKSTEAYLMIDGVKTNVQKYMEFWIQTPTASHQISSHTKFMLTAKESTLPIFDAGNFGVTS